MPRELVCNFSSHILETWFFTLTWYWGYYVTLYRILGGRAFGLGFSRPMVKMSLVNKTGSGGASEGSGTLGDCAFSVDSVTGRCRAEFQGVHIENLHPLNRGSSGTGWKYDKFAFLFHTMVHVCGCDIPLQVGLGVSCVEYIYWWFYCLSCMCSLQDLYYWMLYLQEKIQYNLTKISSKYEEWVCGIYAILPWIECLILQQLDWYLETLSCSTPNSCRKCNRYHYLPLCCQM